MPIFRSRPYKCPKHVELFMIINKIFASSWYLKIIWYLITLSSLVIV